MPPQRSTGNFEALRGSSFGAVFFDEYATLDKKTMRKIEKIEIPHWSKGIDFGFEQEYKCKYKKEKKMSKKVKLAAFVDLCEELGFRLSNTGEYVIDERQPSYDATVYATSERVEPLHTNSQANIQALRKDFELLLEHLGLELKQQPKAKLIVKKGKK